MFNKGDYIKYGFYSRLKVVGKDEKHYLLEDCGSNRKNNFIELVEKHGEPIVDGVPALSEYDKGTVKYFKKKKVAEKNALLCFYHQRSSRLDDIKNILHKALLHISHGDKYPEEIAKKAIDDLHKKEESW